MHIAVCGGSHGKHRLHRLVDAPPVELLVQLSNEYLDQNGLAREAQDIED